LASMSQGRLYHSTAILLPDARVLVTGGGRFFGSPDPTDQFSAELFAPPYLFRGARPVIGSAPSQIAYNEVFTVGTAQAAQVSRVVLTRLPSVTHNIDMDQAYLSLTFSAGTGSLSISAPANSNLAPPGYYMLFIVNGSGVPSVAAIVKL
ncbi:MAG TPA: galactose oxidase early set domain-containing protein, partial [Gemmatimonadaceae bacterium]|nr:galactose oxidase early set domain-containing protein [Gemmatimonadaceae bacterium]